MLKSLADKLIKPLLSFYLKKERHYEYKGFSLLIFPGVFHPAFFFSSKYLFGFAGRLELENRACLEIGSGSGLLSLLMSRKKGMVTAIDIDEKAVSNTRLNWERNKQQCREPFTILQSDLFDQVPAQKFDTVLINPPYFFKAVDTDAQYAWNCGPEGEYFSKLFLRLPAYVHPHSQVYMVLADNCDIDRIRGIAQVYGITFELKAQKKIRWETNFIFAISVKATAV